MTILIGEKTRKNIEELQNCPIVQELWSELRDMDIDIISEHDNNGYHFMTVTNGQYHHRGGHNNQTLGAVSQAIYNIEVEYQDRLKYLKDAQ
jgi:hypothetical protein